MTESYEIVQKLLNESARHHEPLTRSLRKALNQIEEGKKPHQELSKLQKMWADSSRLQVLLAEKLSKLPPPARKRSTFSREDWHTLRYAMLRNEEPLWDENGQLAEIDEC